MSSKRKEARARKEEERAKKIFRYLTIILLALAILSIVAFSIFL